MLQILAIISLLIVLLLALIYVVIRIRLLSILISIFIFLAFTFFLAVAVLVTAANIFISTLINSIFDGIGLRAVGGGPLLALLWVNVGLVLLTLLVWFAKWHRAKFVRRRKEKEVVMTRAVGGGKSFPTSFFKGKKSGKSSASNTAESTPIHETFTKKNKEVEYA